MYLVGRDPARKLETQLLVKKQLGQRRRLVTDAEVLQEILHRYQAIKRLDAIQPAFDALLEIADEVLPVGLEALERAKRVVLGYQRVAARDAVHLAVMQQHGIAEIMSFDSGFDGFPGVTRLF
jgi:uncharacterized protein